VAGESHQFFFCFSVAQWVVACPQVLEISSVAHQPSCFGVGFSLCWFTGGLFLCLTPFLWGKVSDPSAGPLLSACCDGLLIVFQFCNVIWLWMLLTDSGDELCGLLATCCISSSSLSPACYQPFCLSSHLFTESSHWDQLLAPLHFSSAFIAPRPPLLCISFQFFVYSVFCFVLRSRGSVCPGG
jgi:hypothetical protein